MSATLKDLVSKLASMDDLDELPADVDFAELVGDIRGKTDAVKAVLERLENYEQFLAKRIEPLRKAKHAAARNADRLKDYVRHVMEASAMMKLPGDLWNVRLQKSPQRLVFTREATAEDYDDYPGLVRLERHYSWNREKLKEMVADGVASYLPFIKVEEGHHVRFYLNKDAAFATNPPAKAT